MGLKRRQERPQKRAQTVLIQLLSPTIIFTQNAKQHQIQFIRRVVASRAPPSLKIPYFMGKSFKSCNKL